MSVRAVTWLKQRIWGWKLTIVVIAWLIALAVAAVLGVAFKEHLHNSRGDLYVGFYASWVCNLSFFSLVGAASLFYSSPGASVEEGMRTLYGRNPPPALRDYIRRRVERLGVYTETAERHMDVIEYSLTHDAFKVETRSEFIIRNIFIDAPYSEDVALNIFVDKFVEPPVPMGGIKWIKLGDTEKLTGNDREFGPEGYRVNIAFRIPPNSSVPYQYRYWVWHKVGETSNQVPRRVTLKSITKMRNLTTQPVVICLSSGNNPVIIQPNEIYDFSEEYDKTPDDVLFSFVFLAPPPVPPDPLSPRLSGCHGGQHDDRITAQPHRPRPN